MSSDENSCEERPRGKLGEMLDRDRKVYKRKQLLRRLKRSRVFQSCVKELATSLRDLSASDNAVGGSLPRSSSNENLESEAVGADSKEKGGSRLEPNDLNCIFPTPSTSQESNSSQFSFDFEETETSLEVCMSNEEVPYTDPSPPRPSSQSKDDTSDHGRRRTGDALFNRFLVYTREMTCSNTDQEEYGKEGTDQGEGDEAMEADELLSLLLGEDAEDPLDGEGAESTAKEVPTTIETRSLSGSMSAFYSRLQRQLVKKEEASEIGSVSEEESSLSSSQHTSLCSSFYSPMSQLVIRGYSREAIRGPLYQPEEYGDINLSHQPQEIYDDVVYSYDHSLLPCYQDEEWKEFRKLLKRERKNADRERNKFEKLKDTVSEEKPSTSYGEVFKFLERYGSKKPRKRTRKKKKKSTMDDESRHEIPQSVTMAPCSTPLESTSIKVQDKSEDSIFTVQDKSEDSILEVQDKSEDEVSSPKGVVDESRSISFVGAAIEAATAESAEVEE